MSKRIAVIMIRHPEHRDLILHGRRRDNSKWSAPGGHLEEGETPVKGAYRELFEETGIKPYLMTPRSIKTVNGFGGEMEIHLFEAQCPPDLNLEIGNDPDSEFEMFKFLDPCTHEDMHVPEDRNIMVPYLRNEFDPNGEVDHAIPGQAPFKQLS